MTQNEAEKSLTATSAKLAAAESSFESERARANAAEGKLADAESRAINAEHSAAEANARLVTEIELKTKVNLRPLCALIALHFSSLANPIVELTRMLRLHPNRLRQRCEC